MPNFYSNLQPSSQLHATSYKSPPVPLQLPTQPLPQTSDYYLTPSISQTTPYYNPTSVTTSDNDNDNDDSTDSLSSNKENASSTTSNSAINLVPAYFTTQKIVTQTTKLSYTVYQLELLNAIYTDMKYPNSVQKTLIGKLIGITRDQVKIWFQNRRRKDTLLSQGKLPLGNSNNLINGKSTSLKRRKSTDDFESHEEEEETNVASSTSPSSTNSSDQDSFQRQQHRVVEPNVIDQVLYQLRSHHNAPSRLSTKRTTTTVSNTKTTSSSSLNSTSNSNEAKKFKQDSNQLPQTSTSINQYQPQPQPLEINVTNLNPNVVSSSLSSRSSGGNNNSSSLLIATSSSSSSSSSSSLSSDEEHQHQYLYTPNQTFTKQHQAQMSSNQVKFNVMPSQSFSIQDYVMSSNTNNSNSYYRPKINNYQNQVWSPTNYAAPTFKQQELLTYETSANEQYPSYSPYCSNNGDYTNVFVKPSSSSSTYPVSSSSSQYQQFYNSNQQFNQYSQLGYAGGSISASNSNYSLPNYETTSPSIVSSNSTSHLHLNIA